MKPLDPKVIDILNDVLTAELAAINQYFVHSEMCRNWGYARLAAVLKEAAMRPAAEIIQAAYEAVLAHAAGSPQEDDLTAVVIRRVS